MNIGKKTRFLVAGVAVCAATSASALTTWTFELLGDTRTGLVGTHPTFDPTYYGVIARGSFSSNLSSGVLGLADLSSFKLRGVAADIASFSMNLTNPFSSFSMTGHRHFEFDTTTSSFTGSAGAVPGDVYAAAPGYPRAMLALFSAGTGGVFADYREPSYLAGQGAIVFSGYGMGSAQGIYHFDVSSVNLAAVPEPSAIALAIAGLGALAFLSRRRRLTAPLA